MQRDNDILKDVFARLEQDATLMMPLGRERREQQILVKKKLSLEALQREIDTLKDVVAKQKWKQSPATKQEWDRRDPVKEKVDMEIAKQFSKRNIGGWFWS